MKRFEIHNADCREVMKSLPANSIDSIVTDPPYGLEFMGKGWDRGVPGVEFWTEALRVLKPGGHLLAFGGTRTFHRLTVAIEDSGFEIRDCLGWIYGSGFPKSHNVALSIDKKNGAENRGRAIPTASTFQASDLERKNKLTSNKVEAYKSKFPESKEWEGWGTALKPAWEPIILARKPLAGTVAENILEFRTGGLNIDACRIGTGSGKAAPEYVPNNRNAVFDRGMGGGAWDDSKGRWPANILHDGSEEAIGIFPINTSDPHNPNLLRRPSNRLTLGLGGGQVKVAHGDSGSAARFFYCAKASKADREAGNIHPTVKPSALMKYLCRLVTAPGGTILDPFAGSGSTGKAAIAEGFRFLGAELDPAYAEIARARCEAAEIKAGDQAAEDSESDAQLNLFSEGEE